jgi:hypothetical protein
VKSLVEVNLRTGRESIAGSFNGVNVAGEEYPEEGGHVNIEKLSVDPKCEYEVLVL